MKVWEIDDGERHWYSAETQERALDLHMEPLKRPDGTYDLTEFADEIEVTPFPDDKTLSVWDDDIGEFVSMTAAQWAAQGEGLIGTTVY